MQTVKLKTTAVAGGAQLQGDHDRLLQEVNALQKRLTAANLQLDAAIAERDQFELQASKNERALSLMQEERDVLQVREFFFLLPVRMPLTLPHVHAHDHVLISGRLTTKPSAVAGAP